MFPNPFQRYQAAEPNVRLRSTDRIILPTPDFQAAAKVFGALRQQQVKEEDKQAYQEGVQWAQQNPQAVRELAEAAGKEMTEQQLRAAMRELMQQGLSAVLPQTIDGGMRALGKSHVDGFVTELEAAMSELRFVDQDGDPILNDKAAEAAYQRVYQRYSTAPLLKAPQALEIFVESAENLRSQFLGKATLKRLEVQHELSVQAAEQATAVALATKMLDVYASPDRLLTPREQETAEKSLREEIDAQVVALRQVGVLSPAPHLVSALEMVVSRELTKEVPDTDFLLALVTDVEETQVGTTTLGMNPAVSAQFPAMRGRIREASERLAEDEERRAALREAKTTRQVRALHAGVLARAAAEGTLTTTAQTLRQAIEEDSANFPTAADRYVAQQELVRLTNEARVAEDIYDGDEYEKLNQALARGVLTEQAIDTSGVSLSRKLELQEKLAQAQQVPQDIQQAELVSSELQQLNTVVSESAELPGAARVELLQQNFELRASIIEVGSTTFQEALKAGKTPQEARQDALVAQRAMVSEAYRRVSSNVEERVAERAKLVGGYQTAAVEGRLGEALQLLNDAQQAGYVSVSEGLQVRERYKRAQDVQSNGAAVLSSQTVENAYAELKQQIALRLDVIAGTPEGAAAGLDSTTSEGQAQVRLKALGIFDELRASIIEKADVRLKELPATVELPEQIEAYIVRTLLPEARATLEKRLASVEPPGVQEISKQLAERFGNSLELGATQQTLGELLAVVAEYPGASFATEYRLRTGRVLSETSWSPLHTEPQFATPEQLARRLREDAISVQEVAPMPAVFQISPQSGHFKAQVTASPAFALAAYDALAHTEDAPLALAVALETLPLAEVTRLVAERTVTAEELLAGKAVRTVENNLARAVIKVPSSYLVTTESELKALRGSASGLARKNLTEKRNALRAQEGRLRMLSLNDPQVGNEMVRVRNQIADLDQKIDESLAANLRLTEKVAVVVIPEAEGPETVEFDLTGISPLEVPVRGSVADIENLGLDEKTLKELLAKAGMRLTPETREIFLKRQVALLKLYRRDE